MTVLAILLVGAATGFLGGLFGKGGSALATPILAALGVPPIVALVGPLPATIPATLVAGRQYARRGMVDRRVASWCVAVGVPVTVAGALLTRRVSADALVGATEVVVLLLGVGILAGAGRARSRRLPGHGPTNAETAVERARPGGGAARAITDPGPSGPATAVVPPVAGRRSGEVPAVGAVVAVAAGVGLLAGLLANSGGFLLAPLFLVVLRLPVRSALGTSLVVSAALAVPGAAAHTALGHLDPTFVATFAAASVPLAALGARTALRVDPHRLEVAFGAGLVLVAAALLAWA